MREGLPEGCRLLMLGDVMKHGKTAPVPRMFVPGKDGAPEDALVSLYYTSGSTGLPKGAMYTDKLWRRWWCALDQPVVIVLHPPCVRRWSQLRAVSSMFALLDLRSVHTGASYG